MSELDDFFAKKDKSKKKSKGKKNTENDAVDGPPKERLVKKVKKKKEEVVDVGIVAQPAVTTKPSPSASLPKQKGPDNNEDAHMEIAIDNEWNDYDPDEKDYTGLRIQHLQIGDQNDESKEAKEEDGTGGSDDEAAEQGPWSSVGQTIIVAPRPVTPPVIPATTASSEEPKKPSKYMTPAQRAAGYAPPSAATPLSGGGGGWRNRRRNAPNITSDAEFPTLGNASDSFKNPIVGGGTFEQVRSGGRQIGDPSTHRNQVELGNKFDVLQGKAN